MLELLQKLEGDELIGFILGLVALVGGLSCAIISVIFYNWRCVRVTEMEATLKQQMLEKGLSAAEIAQVMNTTPDKLKRSCRIDRAARDRRKLVETLAENGMSGEDIERVLKALPPTPVDNHAPDGGRVTSPA